MSAIFGILRLDVGAVSGRDLERMGNVLAHRGPEGRKFVTDGAIGLGHCLLRVNHEDRFEAQPLRDRGADVILVADCRIDNREELAEQFGLAAADLGALPDSALILQAYKKWGEGCAEHLLGDFAFAIWDRNQGKLVLSRDHMGQRNIFYHRGGDFLAFATEIKSLWALADVPRRLLDKEIARFFYRTGAQRPEGGTRYAGICALPGGTVAVAGVDGAFQQRRYWEPHADPAHEKRDEAYYIEKYRGVLGEAVVCRLRRLTAPAALLMSAGFDTAAIAGLAEPVLTTQQRKLIGLSWLGEEATKVTRGDIRPWLDACRRVMPHLDVRELSRARQAPFIGIEKLFFTTDGPGPGSRKTTAYLFGEAAAAGARLVMDGFGGDYTINPRGFGALARHLSRGQFRPFLRELRAHLKESGQSFWQTLKHEIILSLLPQSVIRWQRSVRQIGSYALYSWAVREIVGPYLEKLRRLNAAEAGPGLESIPITAMRARNRYVADKNRRSPAAAGALAAAAQCLDLTRPFHDKRVVELALAIPEDLYVKNGLDRFLARRALAGIYPPEFQRRGRRNEGALGDFAILDLSEPEFLAEVCRLAKSERLSAYFDLRQARRVLTEPNENAATAARKAAALRALLTAKFIEWFSGSNA
jgi:asparagine synthase (glutamine-hydrolysing)